MAELELYKAHTWENKDENGNVTSGAPALSATNLQKMDNGIQRNNEYLSNLIDDVENLKNTIKNFVKVLIFSFASFCDNPVICSNLKSFVSCKGTSKPAESMRTIPFPSLFFKSGNFMLNPSVLMLNDEGMSK